MGQFAANSVNGLTQHSDAPWLLMEPVGQLLGYVHNYYVDVTVTQRDLLNIPLLSLKPMDMGSRPG